MKVKLFVVCLYVLVVLLWFSIRVVYGIDFEWFKSDFIWYDLLNLLYYLFVYIIYVYYCLLGFVKEMFFGGIVKLCRICCLWLNIFKI